MIIGHSFLSQDQKSFWSTTSLKKKIDIWTTEQIRSIFVPLVDLKSNEQIYDVGSGFSPLGRNFLPYLLPNGTIKGFDLDQKTVNEANKSSVEQGISNYISFSQADVYTIDEMDLPLVDLVMCQQLLVNLPDPVTALEHMINVTKSTGRLLCIENINYGAYVYRPDFSWKTNLKLSQIWQQLCITGKFGYDHGDTTFGTNLPQVFYELGLQDISWQIISSGVNPKPPYTKEFKQSFLENYADEKKRIKELIETHWGPNTNLSKKKIKFFIDQVILSDYDQYAVTNNLFLTQWFYPFIAIVGWLNEKPKREYSENVSLSL